MRIVDVGVFAHNEESGIAAMLTELARQTVFRDPRYSVRVLVLANGCVDDTVKAAGASINAFPDPNSIHVLDLAEGGKSRTWNLFVHEYARPDADILVFCDADISLPKESAIASLADFLETRSDIEAASSLPVKDIDYRPKRLGFVERIISAGGASADKVRTAICGQLYVMRRASASAIRLPVGLPVEDGFVRHAIITHLFSTPKVVSRIDRPWDVMHVYESERRIGPLIRHQIRIVVGGAINAALFSRLVRIRDSGGELAVQSDLARAASDPTWLSTVLKDELPRASFGWVPWPFLVARSQSFVNGGDYGLRRTLIAVVGFLFDLIVYVLAQAKLARGKGAGFW